MAVSVEKELTVKWNGLFIRYHSFVEYSIVDKNTKDSSDDLRHSEKISSFW